MKRLNLTLFFWLSLVHGDIEIERSPTYFRDQLEVSQVAEVSEVNFERLKKEFLKYRNEYAELFILTKRKNLKILQEKKTYETERKSLNNVKILEDFLTGSMGIKSFEEGEEHTIVSLTSWPPRIHTVFLTIESILRQSHKAHKVVLYLSEEEFPTRELPETLKFQQTRGLEIRWVKENLRSYKKLLYALKEFPKSNIITLDDDRCYDKNLVYCYLNQHKLSTTFVLSCETPEFDVDIKPTFRHGVGGAGILYPPNTFDDRVFDVKTILKINPVSDDEWFACALIANEKTFLKIDFEKAPHLLRGKALSSEYSKKIFSNLQYVHLLKHNCMEYFNLYEKLNVTYNPKVLEYLESKKKK